MTIPPDLEAVPGAAHRRWAWVGTFVGVAGVLATFAIALLPSILAKIAGVSASITAAFLLWQATLEKSRGRLSTSMIVTLGAFATTFVLLLVALAAQPANPSTASPGSHSDGVTELPAGSRSPTASKAAPKLGDSSSSAEQEGPKADTLPHGDKWLSELDVSDGGAGWAPGSALMREVSYPHSVIVEQCATRTMSVNLNRRFNRFTALVGVSDDAPTKARHEFTVTDGDKNLFQSRELKPGDQEFVDVPVAGVFRLTLQMSYAYCIDAGAVWADARLHA
jgi:hypothetical protein